MNTKNDIQGIETILVYTYKYERDERLGRLRVSFKPVVDNPGIGASS